MVEGSTTSAAPVLEKEEINKWVVPTKQAEIASEVDEETVDETDDLTQSSQIFRGNRGNRIPFLFSHFLAFRNCFLQKFPSFCPY